MTSFSGVTFVLFCFASRLYAFVEAAALRSIVLRRYASAPIATRFFFFFFGDVAFSEYFFVPFPFPLCMLLLIHTFSVLSLQLKKLRRHNKSAIDLSNANPACDHKEVRRSTGHPSYVLSFRMVFFYLVTTGWIFDISLCENLINQIKYSLVHHTTVQYSTVQRSTVQYSTVQQYNTVQYSTVQHSTAQYSTV